MGGAIAQNGDGALGQSGPMRRAIDPAGQARDNHHATGAQRFGDLMGDFKRRRRSVSRPDHGDHWAFEQMRVAMRGNHWRGVGQGGQGAWVVGRAPNQIVSAQLLRVAIFLLGFG